MQSFSNNIFICQTPLQDLIAKTLTNSKFQDSKSFHNYIFSSHQRPEKKGNTTIISLKGNWFIKIISIIFYYFKLKNLLNTNHSSFIPHIGGFLPKYIFQRSDKVNFCYEGILYFYDYAEPKTTRHFYRSVLGFILGVKYKYSPTIFPYDSLKIDKIYTPVPELTKGPYHKLEKITIQSESFVPQKKSALVLGGFPSALTRGEVREINIKIMSALISNKVEKIYFKPHHRDRFRIFEKVATENKIEYQTIESSNSAEELLPTINPESIYAYPSSALINIKIIYGETVKIECFYPNNRKRDITHLKKVFDYFKIAIK